MELLLNELSFHGQLSNQEKFIEAIKNLLTVRCAANKFGFEIYCNRNVYAAKVNSEKNIVEFVRTLEKNLQRALMLWITKNGPFLDDTPHGPDDCFTFNGDRVTETALGEAALGSFLGLDRRMISVAPSDWEIDPLVVNYSDSNSEPFDIPLQNYWQPEELVDALQKEPLQMRTWRDLEFTCRKRFENFVFLKGAFVRLNGEPFSKYVCERTTVLLYTLDRLQACVDENGNRTSDGDQLYNTHFTGEKSWFSPSSASEKKDFKSEMTFDHPTMKGKKLLSHWHGKIKSPQFRIHFSWPEKKGGKIFVAYIGPKITKR